MRPIRSDETGPAKSPARGFRRRASRRWLPLTGKLYVKHLGLASVVVLSLAACSDAPIPTEPGTPPRFSAATSSLGYTAIDLGTLGGLVSGAFGINEAGQVVGESFTASGHQHAFLWDGTMHDLGTLGGTQSLARAINDAGQVVGYRVISGEQHAFLLDGTTMQDLGTLGGNFSRAYGINDAGQVVDESTMDSGEVHATLWQMLTPVEQLQTCAALVSELEAQVVLNQGQAHSLVNNINLATAMLNGGKNTPALNMLAAFQNKANAYVNGGYLTQEQGDELVACVQGVVDALVY